MNNFFLPCRRPPCRRPFIPLRRGISAVVIAAVVMLSACATPGKTKNPHTTWAAQQMQEAPGALLVSTPIGWQIAKTGPGAGQQSPVVVLPPKFSVQRVTRDARLWVLTDSNTNLYVWRPEKERFPVEIEALHGRTGSVVVSPDLSALVVSRHPNFALPQEQWDDDEDDRLFVVNLETLEVDEIPPTQKTAVGRLFWSAVDPVTFTPSTLEVEYRDFKDGKARGTQLAWATRTRTPQFDRVDASTVGAPQFASPPQCPARGRLANEADHLDLISPSGEVTTLIALEGKRRGFHDYRPAFEGASFGPSCRLVSAIWDGKLIGVSVEPPHAIAELMGASSVMYLDAAPPMLER